MFSYNIIVKTFEIKDKALGTIRFGSQKTGDMNPPSVVVYILIVLFLITN